MIRRARHYPGCFGCGEANPIGLKLEGIEEDGTILITHDPPSHAQGGPGVVHGGYLAALADEAIGMATMTQATIPGMTRRLEVDYLAPAWTSKTLHLRSWVEDVTERKMIVFVEARSGDDESSCFKAKAICVRVPLETWVDVIVSQDADCIGGVFGGDLGNYFRWQLEFMKLVYDPSRVGSPITISLRLDDVEPACWILNAGLQELTAVEGDPQEFDAAFRGQVRDWQSLVKAKSVAAVEGLHGVVIQGEAQRLEELVKACTYR